ncbi:MAG: hypothetical protein PHC51_09470 [bacterium]|nr:hypothetical protein [bacterium]
MKLPIVDGKKIVPVRLIPIITVGKLGRTDITGILAHRLRADGFPLTPEYEQIEVMVDGELTIETRAQLFGPSSNNVEIYAFHINEDNEPVRMLSTEWDEIYREISVLEPLLRKEEEIIGVPDSKESTWIIESLKTLPAGVFIWREDMDKLWSVCNNHLSLPGEREDSRKMNYDALVLPKYRDLVLEGFEEIMKSGKSTVSKQHEPKPNVKIQESLLKMVIAMAIDCYSYDSTSKQNKATSDIMEALEKIGLPLAENTIRTHLKNAAELIPRDLNQNSQ